MKKILLLQIFFFILSLPGSLLANFLTTPEELYQLELNLTQRSFIRFCKQSSQNIFGRNPISPENNCYQIPEAEVNLESWFPEEKEAEGGETQWSFYDLQGKQIYPSIKRESAEPTVFVSLVRSKRGSFSVQLQRKRDGAYFFLRTKLSFWAIP